MARVAAPSERLRPTVRLASLPLAAATERFATHPRAADVYPLYLVSMLAVMRGILGVMDSALERANALTGEDPVAEGVARYLERHIAEEAGHDAWVLDDLTALGVDPSAEAARLPRTSVAELIGTQYYWVFQVHPVAVLGYLAVAEGEPTSLAVVQRLVEVTGHPRGSFRTLFEHAELDASHGDELYEVIDSLPLDNTHEDLLVRSAVSAATIMARVLEDVLRFTEGA